MTLAACATGQVGLDGEVVAMGAGRGGGCGPMPAGGVACREALSRRIGSVVAVVAPTGHTGGVTAEQLELISTDPQVMHGQAVLVGTRVPVSVILDCLAAGMTVEEIIEEYPVVTEAGVRAAAAYGAALAREELLPLPHSQ